METSNRNLIHKPLKLEKHKLTNNSNSVTMDSNKHFNFTCKDTYIVCYSLRCTYLLVSMREKLKYIYIYTRIKIFMPMLMVLHTD